MFPAADIESIRAGMSPKQIEHVSAAILAALQARNVGLESIHPGMSEAAFREAAETCLRIMDESRPPAGFLAQLVNVCHRYFHPTALRYFARCIASWLCALLRPSAKTYLAEMTRQTRAIALEAAKNPKPPIRWHISRHTTWRGGPTLRFCSAILPGMHGRYGYGMHPQDRLLSKLASAKPGDLDRDADAFREYMLCPDGFTRGYGIDYPEVAAYLKDLKVRDAVRAAEKAAAEGCVRLSRSALRLSAHNSPGSSAGSETPAWQAPLFRNCPGWHYCLGCPGVVACHRPAPGDRSNVSGNVSSRSDLDSDSWNHSPRPLRPKRTGRIVPGAGRILTQTRPAAFPSTHLRASI